MPFFSRASSSSNVRHSRIADDEELEAAFNPPPQEHPSTDLYDEARISSSPARRQSPLSRDREVLPSPQIIVSNADLGGTETVTGQAPPQHQPAYDFEANFADQATPSVTPVNPRPIHSPNSNHGHTFGPLANAASPSVRTRIAQAIFGQYYGRVATADPDQNGQYQTTHTRGHRRAESNTRDGVFANLSAKPERRPALQGDEFVGGDDEGNFKEQPPTYESAAADATPPYWETTIIAPHGSYLTGAAGPDDVLVEGLPVGNLFAFAWNMLVSMSFQFVGFLLTYLLHTSHAAKHGSRAGLGITLIQYSFYLKSRANALQAELDKGEIPPELIGFFPPTSNSTDENGGMVFDEDGDQSFPGMPQGWADWGKDSNDGPSTSLAHDLINDAVATATATSEAEGALPSTIAGLPAPEREGLTNAMKMSSMANDWLSYMLMVLGWALLFAACLSYFRAWKYSRAIRGENRASRSNDQSDVQVVVL